MDTQIYLMLVRKVGKFPTGKDMNGPKAAFIAKQALQSFILGDSLDVPFVKLIRVQSVSHSIAFDEKKAYNASKDEFVTHGAASTYKDVIKEQTFLTSTRTRQAIGKRIAGDHGWKAPENATSLFARNKFTKVKLPEQNEFTFTKYVDNATPQLAFACSAQEAFPFALFFFRRKGGTGVEGIRNPFLSIGLYKSIITSWELGSDLTETVKMKYTSIAWSSLDTWGDSELPLGIPSMRWWNDDDHSGGELGWGVLLQLVAQGLTAIAQGALGGQAAASNDEFSAE